jgi:hypothetical protein
LQLFPRKAKKSAMGAEAIEKRLLVSQDLRFFRFPDEMDDVALLGVALFVDERRKKGGRDAEVWMCPDVFVSDAWSVGHQMR